MLEENLSRKNFKKRFVNTYPPPNTTSIFYRTDICNVLDQPYKRVKDHEYALSIQEHWKAKYPDTYVAYVFNYIDICALAYMQEMISLSNDVGHVALRTPEECFFDANAGHIYKIPVITGGNMNKRLVVFSAPPDRFKIVGGRFYNKNHPCKIYNADAVYKYIYSLLSGAAKRSNQ